MAYAVEIRPATKRTTQIMRTAEMNVLRSTNGKTLRNRCRNERIQQMATYKILREIEEDIGVKTFRGGWRKIDFLNREDTETYRRKKARQVAKKMKGVLDVGRIRGMKILKKQA